MTRNRLLLALGLLAAALAAPAPATAERAAPPSPASVYSTPRVLALGDVACDGCADQRTAKLFDPRHHTAVLMLGDLQYPNGTDAEFASSYDRSWGRFKTRTFAVPGNHEYHTKDAGGFFRYFPASRRTARPVTGHPELGYYSFDLGQWHVVGLNSNCAQAGCGRQSAQLRWFEEDLRLRSRACTIVFWHHPRFSSGAHGDTTALRHFWDVAHRYRVDAVLTGHDHHYERFAPMDASGKPDATAPVGFVVGTGGTGLRDVWRTRPGSVFLRDDLHGALELTLKRSSLSWRFLGVDGSVVDPGSLACR